MISSFESYPFEKLRALFSSYTLNTELSHIALTIGEPQFETPSFIQEELKNTAKYLNKYPKSAGEDVLKESIARFVLTNFEIMLKNEQFIPTLGTREVLFNFPQFLLYGEINPVMAYPNPFYQIYEGAALASSAKSLLINLRAENGFKPDIEEFRRLAIGKNIKLVILNSPNNPTASCMNIDEMSEWIKLALEMDFVLLNDECYNQIYFDKKPLSLLEVSTSIGNRNFKNIIVVNSISKRSSAPGLRSGFIAGDAEILSKYASYRTYVGATNGLPMQFAAAKAWSDEAHVVEARIQYRKNFEIAKKILGIDIPEATFYIWLNVKNGVEFAKRAYSEVSVSVLPGEYLARGFASEYVRIALVENDAKCEEGIARLAKLL
jgi:aspartate/methionine/tyrosine aminotransferase